MPNEWPLKQAQAALDVFKKDCEDRQPAWRRFVVGRALKIARCN